MAAINIPQAGMARAVSNFVSSHVPVVSSIAMRLSASTSATTSAAAPQTNEDRLNESYETPSRTFASLLAELFPPFLLAVPKSKTSHSRKSMRSANKGLKNKTNINLCPACGSPKLMHHLCPKCYSQISRRWKEETRSTLAQEQAPISQSRVEQQQQPSV